jgi:hypothetical protein
MLREQLASLGPTKMFGSSLSVGFHRSTYISRAVKGKVQTTVRDLNQMILDFLTFGKFERVDEIGCAKVLGPLFFARVGVDGNDSACTDDRGSGDAAEANRTATKDGDSGILWDGL